LIEKAGVLLHLSKSGYDQINIVIAQILDDNQ
jgi:hypothetical protein